MIGQIRPEMSLSLDRNNKVDTGGLKKEHLLLEYIVLISISSCGLQYPILDSQ